MGRWALYDAPLDCYGQLVHERFTAQRLVVDPEMLRYATDLPGQALAHRLGFLEFTRLRKEVERVQGPAFDVRDFHEHVIDPGALPFPVLDAHLQRWTAGPAR